MDWIEVQTRRYVKFPFDDGDLANRLNRVIEASGVAPLIDVHIDPVSDHVFQVGASMMDKIGN